MRHALALVLLCAVPAQARDLFVDNLAGYMVEGRVLNAPDCAFPANAAPDRQPTATDALERGLCLYHRANRSADDEDAAIRALDEAQVRGLPPVPQQLATLVSGLARCAGADRHLAAFRASGGQAEFERTLFCRDRRGAQADLDAIRWDHALFEYAEGLGTGRSMDARFSEMAACHAGALAPDFDAECGLISNLTDTEIATFVDEAADASIARHFSGVESPITAMFSRKLRRAEGLLETAEAGIAGLATQAAAVNAEHAALQRVYEAARDEKMGPIYDNYRSAILRATAILDEFDRWKGGLFMTAENVNLRPKITERSGELAEEGTRVTDLAFASTAADLVAQIRRLANAREENRALTDQLCRIYFCELLSRRASPDTIRACRRPALAQNPLCLKPDGTVADGTLRVTFDGTPHAAEIGAMCRDAGLDPAFAVPGLAPAQAAACLAGMP
ncbi:hypothetical protein [Paracoccus sp. SSK6]|uniref:hypothetical protein n=1 Tax=Paracoccus sp. SSK6 TaxID=3143131 RepID=UPI00321B82A9